LTGRRRCRRHRRSRHHPDQPSGGGRRKGSGPSCFVDDLVARSGCRQLMLWSEPRSRERFRCERLLLPAWASGR
jgi:hypothetical protein